MKKKFVLNNLKYNSNKMEINVVRKLGNHAICQYNIDTHLFIKYFEDLFGTEELDMLHQKSSVFQKFVNGEIEKLVDIESDLHKKFYTDIKTNEKFKRIYCSFIKTLHKRFFPNEKFLVYQSFPSVRFQFPNSIAVPPHKDSDDIGKHPIGEKNFLVPITDMYGTNTLYIESEPDQEDFQAIEMSKGEFFYFNGNTCTHYNVKNTENKIRISLDFRVMIKDDYMKYINSTNITTTNPRDPQKSRKPTKMLIRGYYQLTYQDEILQNMMQWHKINDILYSPSEIGPLLELHNVEKSEKIVDSDYLKKLKEFLN